MQHRAAIAACIGLLSLASPVKAYEPAIRMPVTMPASPPEQIDVIKGARNPDYCVMFQKVPGFSDWSAKVDDVQTSTVNGAIDISFDVGYGIKLEEVMQKSDPLYPAVAKLKMRQMVRLSGRFVHGNGECGYQMLSIGVALTSVKAAK